MVSIATRLPAGTRTAAGKASWVAARAIVDLDEPVLAVDGDIPEQPLRVATRQQRVRDLFIRVLRDD
jgi:hypothetical protein